MTFQQAQESGADAADGGFDALFASFAHDFDRRAIGHHDQFAAAEYIADAVAVEKLGKLLCARK